MFLDGVRRTHRGATGRRRCTDHVGKRLVTRKPAVAVSGWHELRKASVSDVRVGRLLLDARAVPECGLVHRVGAPVRGPVEGAVGKADGGMLARADGWAGAGRLSGPDKHVLRPGGAMHEVPLAQRPLLALDDDQSLAGD